MRWRTVSLIIFLASATVYSVPVDVNIRETIKGTNAYIDYYKNVTDSAQRFLVDWENQGSVSCKVRLRMDISNEISHQYTGWSGESALEPGDHSELEMYYYPPFSGTFQANITAYYCNTVEDVATVYFTARTSRENVTGNSSGGDKNLALQERIVKPVPVDVTVENTETTVVMKIKPRENLSSLVISPRRYPLGWIFESKRIEDLKQNEERTVTIDYVPPIWKPATIEFDYGTLEGGYHSTREITLQEAKKPGYYTMEQITMIILGITTMLFLALYLRERRKNR